jgi:hypothetical protein
MRRDERRMPVEAKHRKTAKNATGTIQMKYADIKGIKASAAITDNISVITDDIA